MTMRVSGACRGTLCLVSVPTNVAREAADYTNLSDFITGQSGKPRMTMWPVRYHSATVLDPATTRVR